MKKINKTEPDFYKAFIAENSPQSWKDLRKKIGYAVREYMLKEEQNLQCAYTEVYLDPDSSHVDHFKKQSLFPKSVFEWDNLLTSCKNECYGPKFKDRKIRKKEDYQDLIDPVAEDPQKYFNCSMTGDILADEDDKKGKFTIDAFHLNHPVLVEQRKTVAIQVRDMYKLLSLEQLIVSIGKFESFIRAVYAALKHIEDRSKEDLFD